MTSMRFLALIALLPSLVLSSPLDVKRAQGQSLPPPSLDPFYKVPSNISTYERGQVVEKRDVATNVDGGNTATSYQVSYRSTTTLQNPDLTVATIWTPSNPSVNPTKIFSYQAYEDAVALDCNPSWAFTKPTDSANIFISSLDAPLYINYALSKGWYVVAADHEGSQSAFISGRQQGQAVLDGVRALMNSENLATDSQIGLLGYSGGASATVWATNMHESYAPELNVIGAAHGGTPIDTKGLFNFLNKSFFAGFVGAGVVGLSNAYPDLAEFVQNYTTPAGKKLIAKYKQSDYCIAQVALGNPFDDIFKYITIDNPLEEPVPKAILAQETLSIENAADPSQISTPKFPRYIFHGLEDGIIPYKTAKEYVVQQCDTGADITFNTLPIAEHLLGEVLGLVPALSWMTRAFESQNPKVKCGTSTPQIPIRSKKAREVIGDDGVKYLLSLNGKKDAFGQTFHL